VELACSALLRCLAPLAAAGGLLILSAPYRLQRLTGFLNPWEDPFGTGYQLTQALIAFGRGHWLGVGLGNSVQKQFLSARSAYRLCVCRAG